MKILPSPLKRVFLYIVILIILFALIKFSFVILGLILRCGSWIIYILWFLFAGSILIICIAIAIVLLLLIYNQKCPETYNPKYKRFRSYRAENETLRKEVIFETNDEKTLCDDRSNSFEALPFIWWKKKKGSPTIAFTDENVELTYSFSVISCMKIAKSLLEMKDKNRTQVCGLWIPNGKFLIHFYTSCQMAQYVPVILFNNADMELLKRCILETQMTWMIVSNLDKFDCIAKVHEELGEESKLQTIIVTDESFKSTRKGNLDLYSLDEFTSLGQYKSDADVIESMKDIKASNLATWIVPQSENDPFIKLTHGHMVEITRQYAKIVRNQYHPLSSYNNDYWEISYCSTLPLALAVQQALAIWVPFIEAVNVRFIRKVEEMTENMPSIIHLSNKEWENFHASIRDKFAQLSLLKKYLFSWAGKILASTNSISQCHGYNLTVMSELQNHVARYVIQDFKRSLGLSNCNGAFCCQGPLSVELLKFFMRLDVVIQEFFQTSEFGIISTNHLGNIHLGSAGTPIYNVDIDSESTLILKVASLPKYLIPKSDVKEINLGLITRKDDGQIYIDGLVSERMRLLSEKRFFPQHIERHWRELDPVVDDVAILGEGLTFPFAIVSCNTIEARRYMQENGETTVEIHKSAAIQELLVSLMTTINRELPPQMRVKRFIISSKSFNFDSGDYTYSGQIDRANIMDRYQKEIKRLQEKY